MSGQIVFRNRLDPDLAPVNITMIAWELITNATAEGDQFPIWTSYHRPLFDVVSGTSLWYLHRSTSAIIFSTDLYSYRSSTRHWLRIGGTGAPVATCTAGDNSTDVDGNPKLPWPSDRHPVEQMAIDSTRNVLHLIKGVCNGDVPEDHWNLSLNADVTDNTWSVLIGAAEDLPSIEATGSLAYLADPDIFIMHGHRPGSFPVTWAFAPGTGSPSAAQIAAGCTTKGVWFEVYSADDETPPNSQFPHLVALPGTGTVLHFGYADGTLSVWEYTVATQAWADLAPSNGPDENSTVAAPERLVSYITEGPLAGKVYYRQTAHLGTASTPHGDLIYDRGTNAFTTLSTTGTGPRTLTYLVFDPTLGAYGGIVASANDDELWHGVFH